MDVPPLISTREKFRDFCDDLARCETIAFDTEFVPEYTFKPQLCLLQIATERGLALVDPMELGSIARFWEILLEGKRRIIVHAGKEEMNFCWAETGQLPAGAFDVQVAAGFVGFGYPLSLANLISRLMNRAVSTAETRTDWRKRPLTERQLRYALDDVRYLLPIHAKLEKRLDETGRTAWLDAEIAYAFDHIAHADPSERFRKLPGSGRLSPRQLAVLKELTAWRNQRARSIDKPARWILRDDLLVELAKHQPSTAQELKSTRGIGNITGARWVDDLLAAVERGRQVPDETCPDRSERRESPDQQMVLKILAAALIQLSQTHDVAPQLLGSNEDLKDLIEYVADGGPPPRLLRGWRADVCGNYLASLLRGETVFRVRPKDGEFRIVFETADPSA